jgi:hypothetical protein
MFAFFYFEMFQGAMPLMLLAIAFQVWMLVDAVRREEWLWALFIFLFSVLTAFLYFFLVYRPARAMEPSASPGFELPGAEDRQRIQELQEQIRMLDNAHHHSELADIYLRHGKLDEAETGYRAALERDAEELDTHAHFGECLLRQNRPGEALPHLEKVCAAEPNHDYGQTIMTLAETLAALGRSDEALAKWEEVVRRHSYARGRVRLAELYLARADATRAEAQLREVLSDFDSMPAYQRRREAQWLGKAQALMRQLRRSEGLASSG